MTLLFAGRRALAQKSRWISKSITMQRYNMARSASSAADTFEKVGVVGLGLMGHGICQVAATSSVHSSVVAYEAEQTFLDKGRSRIESSLSAMVSKGRMTQDDADVALASIVFTTDIDALQDADFIVEAVIENLDLKRDLYGNLGSLCKPETIFASNTSSLSITEMAYMSGRPEQFLGVHFFNPVQIMKLVEVARTEFTSPEVFEKAYQWVHHIGKVPVKCNDTPGFIVNRLLVPSMAQAMLMCGQFLHFFTIPFFFFFFWSNLQLFFLSKLALLLVDRSK